MSQMGIMPLEKRVYKWLPCISCHKPMWTHAGKRFCPKCSRIVEREGNIYDDLQPWKTCKDESHD